MDRQISELFDNNPYIDHSFGHFALIKGINQDPTDYYMRKECWCEIHIKYKTQRQMTLNLQVADLDLQANSYKFILSEENDLETNMLLTGDINERRIPWQQDPPSGFTQHMEPLTPDLSIMLIRFVRAMVSGYLMKQEVWSYCKGRSELFFCCGIDRKDKDYIEQVSNTFFEDLIIGTQGAHRHYK